MKRVSESFTVADVEFDLYALKNRIENTAPPQALRNAEILAKRILEPLRNAVNFQILSWYRSDALEKAYCKNAFYKWTVDNREHFSERTWSKYASEKQHTTGQAVALRSNNVKALFDYIKANLEFDILSMREGYVHVSFAQDANRKLIV